MAQGANMLSPSAGVGPATRAVGRAAAGADVRGGWEALGAGCGPAVGRGERSGGTSRVWRRASRDQVLRRACRRRRGVAGRAGEPRRWPGAE